MSTTPDNSQRCQNNLSFRKNKVEIKVCTLINQDTPPGEMRTEMSLTMAKSTEDQ
jgi:hypothetical protein